MSPAISWPEGAQPFAEMLQSHDQELLQKELNQGSRV